MCVNQTPDEGKLSLGKISLIWERSKSGPDLMKFFSDESGWKPDLYLSNASSKKLVKMMSKGSENKDLDPLTAFCPF